MCTRPKIVQPSTPPPPPDYADQAARELEQAGKATRAAGGRKRSFSAKPSSVMPIAKPLAGGK